LTRRSRSTPSLVSQIYAALQQSRLDYGRWGIGRFRPRHRRFAGSNFRAPMTLGQPSSSADPRCPRSRRAARTGARATGRALGRPCHPGHLGRELWASRRGGTISRPNGFEREPGTLRRRSAPARLPGKSATRQATEGSRPTPFLAGTPLRTEDERDRWRADPLRKGHSMLRRTTWSRTSRPQFVATWSSMAEGLAGCPSPWRRASTGTPTSRRSWIVTAGLAEVAAGSIAMGPRRFSPPAATQQSTTRMSTGRERGRGHKNLPDVEAGRWPTFRALRSIGSRHRAIPNAFEAIPTSWVRFMMRSTRPQGPTREAEPSQARDDRGGLRSRVGSFRSRLHGSEQARTAGARPSPSW